MSMFWCTRCDNLSDSDDGCEEALGNALICIDCVVDLEDEDDLERLDGMYEDRERES